MDMKLHWGHKLSIAFVLFAGFVFYLISVMLRQRIDMVTDNYYAQELTFQATIDARSHADRLAQKVQVKRQNSHWLISIPACGVKSTGSIIFYRPDDPSKDLLLELSANNQGEQLIDAARLHKGQYELTVQWSSGGIAYEHRQPFIVE